jgi:hypothetical protein
MSKYSQWISLGALILLIVACLMPWTYHADINKAFTGFFSEKNVYGKPGRLLIFLSLLSTLFSFVPKVWAKRTALLIAALNVAYAIKNFLVFGACYRGYCPEKKPGLYFMLMAVCLIMVMALFPKGEIRKRDQEIPVAPNTGEAETTPLA